MTINEISLCAATEQKPSDGMLLPDRCLYYALRDIYKAYKHGAIDADEGTKQKAVALRQYEIDRAEVDRAEQYIQHNAEMWKRIESTGSELSNVGQKFTSAPSMDNAIDLADKALKFMEAVYGCKMKEAQH